MTPTLVAALTATFALAFGAWTAVSATRRPQSRVLLLARLAGALAILLLVRLIGPFGGWGDWFVWVWFAAVAVYAWTGYRAAAAWPGLPWRASGPGVPRGGGVRLGVAAAILLAVTGALVVPGILLG